MPQQSKVVMISSTARDLPEHRDKVMHACQRLGMFHPDIMEHLTATDANALEVSLEMVNKADIYIGVFAFRYGYIPEGQTISVTEAEYNRAFERKIPRLIFLMSDDHPVKPSDVETGEGAEKLRLLKERLKKDRVIGSFSSADDLGGQVIQALVEYRTPDLTAFHYVSEIPEPPEAFIAHPYTLLQTHRLVGRQEELNLLTDWVSKPGSDIYAARILNIVAIGGMGKSAVTWKWFNDIAPQEMKPLAGRMWWSFYESDATFENFVTRALAYVTRRSLNEVEQIPAPDRETQLLGALDREPVLIVLDGLERLLIAYARMEAAHMDDLGARASSPAALSSEGVDSATIASRNATNAEAAAGDTGAPREEHRLRKTADPRAGAFLRNLAAVRTARILISTRLYATDLENRVNGEPLPGCFRRDLHGLTDDDALEVWRRFGVTGARDTLLPIFHRVENHPLLIQALAAEAARFRAAPGDFEQWRQSHPDFDPFRDVPLVQMKSHVLDFALRGLDDKARETLGIIAAFRMPASYDTLTALLIGEGKPCADERALDAVLAELEDRGLVGWDKRANRYDLHPIVRGVVWSGLADDAQRGVYTNLHEHFESLPKIDDWHEVGRLEDLTPAIELYNTLIGLGRFDDAYIVFLNRLSKAMHFRLSASRQRVELLELLFPDGLEQLPRLRDPNHQAYTLNALAIGYVADGRPGRAAPLFRVANTIASERSRNDNLSAGLGNLANVLRLSGALREAEAAAHQPVDLNDSRGSFQEAVRLRRLGSILAARGMVHESASALQRSQRVFVAQSNTQSEGTVCFDLAQRAMWLGVFTDAQTFASRAWKLAHARSFERDVIRAARMQGAAALGLHDFAVADERLHHAVSLARQVNFVEEELASLIALAELRRLQGKANEARELLDDVWDAAERGPYPLFHADACNVLAQLERDAGNLDKAIAAATEAHRLAWCDGPPFAYHWGLVAARKHLQELGAPEPEMPPFDESKFEPMPEVEIDPDDEFHAGKNAGDA